MFLLPERVREDGRTATHRIMSRRPATSLAVDTFVWLIHMAQLQFQRDLVDVRQGYCKDVLYPTIYNHYFAARQPKRLYTPVHAALLHLPAHIVVHSQD